MRMKQRKKKTTRRDAGNDVARTRKPEKKSSTSPACCRSGDGDTAKVWYSEWDSAKWRKPRLVNTAGRMTWR